MKPCDKALESQKRMLLNTDRHELDLERMRQNIEQSHATVEQMRIDNDKFRAQAKKIEKEAQPYPYVTLGAAMVGGLMVFVLTKFLG